MAGEWRRFVKELGAVLESNDKTWMDLVRFVRLFDDRDDEGSSSAPIIRGFSRKP
jgi:hypothetical protein|tara:strand:+ start:380 stop:544 length:165 start_codon:yes stop_codon:yes gene_type:complete